MTFDGGNAIKCNRKCYFFDCGEVAQTVSKVYGGILPIEGFISGDVTLIGKTLNNRKIFSLDEVLAGKDNYIIIATNKEVEKISAELSNRGLSSKQDFCHYKEWIRKYFETLLHEKDQLVSDYLELYITDRCTLKCKACILFAPYTPKPYKDRDFDSVKRDIETYFNFVDKVSVFRLMGGEPFLYHNFEELLKFITVHQIRGGGGTYRQQMESMIVVSNGTVIPSANILKMLAENSIEVHVSDYPVEIAQRQRAKLIQAFEKAGVRYKIKPMRWVDVNSNPDVVKHTAHNELVELFQKCFVRCRTIYEGKLYFCAIDAAAQRQGYIKGSADDYVDLNEQVERGSVREKILSLDAGEIRKGYVSFCRNCWGGTDSNNRIIPIAEQL